MLAEWKQAHGNQLTYLPLNFFYLKYITVEYKLDFSTVYYRQLADFD